MFLWKLGVLFIFHGFKIFYEISSAGAGEGAVGSVSTTGGGAQPTIVSESINPNH